MKDRRIKWEELNLFASDDDGKEQGQDEDEVDYLEKEKSDMVPYANIRLNKLVQTPLGPFILNDTFHPLRGLTVLVAHINFKITKDLLQKLDDVDGIEAFKILGRYRILFIFGKMFQVDDVIKDLESAMQVTNNIDKISIEDLNEQTQEILYDLNRYITSEHWVAYIFPNGKYIYENFNNEANVKDKYEEYLQLYNMSHGIILSSLELKND